MHERWYVQELFEYFEDYCDVDDQSNQQPHQPLNLQEVFDGDCLPKFQHYPIEEGVAENVDPEEQAGEVLMT